MKLSNMMLRKYGKSSKKHRNLYTQIMRRRIKVMKTKEINNAIEENKHGIS